MGAATICGVVVAAGTSSRFGGRQKQFETVGGARMIDRSVKLARSVCDFVAVVLPPGRSWDGGPVDGVTCGGDHPSESVRAGLAALPDDTEIVALIDPAHPLASVELVQRLIDAVRAGADGAVPVIPILEVIQLVREGRVIETLPKTDLVITQSPQVFRMSVLRAVHLDEPRPVENSSLLVERGYRVDVVPGDPVNIHVSTPRELEMADRLADV